jgi:hypothetical protein
VSEGAEPACERTHGVCGGGKHPADKGADMSAKLVAVAARGLERWLLDSSAAVANDGPRKGVRGGRSGEFAVAAAAQEVGATCAAGHEEPGSGTCWAAHAAGAAWAVSHSIACIVTARLAVSVVVMACPQETMQG